MNLLRSSSTVNSLNKLFLLSTRQFHQATPALSHIGRQAITYSNEITVEHDLSPITKPRIPSELNNTLLTIKGPLGQLQLPIKPFVKINLTPASKDDVTSENILKISVEDEQVKEQRTMWGTTRALINNAILGVSDGYKVHLRLVGVGYRATLENNKVLSFKLGYSHPILMELPEGVTCSVPAPNRVILQGIDLQKVTEFAAKIQRWRMPEPYNQKGIFINDETIKKKEGKKK
ncbi:ribosomal protein L6, alpha-beta domain-containing protein [Cokeromyces recurvatus]|uniref:ribosomal protein L6, alpha-beta domain-containing protein n=1 Tax=Cokeromyces recurvatus TaxID=90255 RepID=UPI00222089E1|nr:ribosomal protein L6, alpha-beta domain-containing protein [Cokeromyces recurvatus]KAI7900481.1 ribosomal protein L6, alpha-beta domain-containing protein [Cokeromyces recurvatus]